MPSYNNKTTASFRTCIGKTECIDLDGIARIVIGWTGNLAGTLVIVIISILIMAIGTQIHGTTISGMVGVVDMDIMAGTKYMGQELND